MVKSLELTDKWLQVQSVPLEMIAEEIRRLISYVGEMTGEISTEDILHGIFGKFCVGK
jgi:tRNA modification GTPase